MNKNFITFLINLKRSPDRLQKMKSELERQNIDFERIEAIDSNSLYESDLDICDTPNIEYPYRIKAGELACFLSHRICWEKLIKSEKEWGLIIEDHCVLSSKACNYLRSTDWIPKECRNHTVCIYTEARILSKGNKTTGRQLVTQYCLHVTDWNFWLFYF